jgi:hypothetical protein
MKTRQSFEGYFMRTGGHILTCAPQVCVNAPTMYFGNVECQSYHATCAALAKSQKAPKCAAYYVRSRAPSRCFDGLRTVRRDATRGGPDTCRLLVRSAEGWRRKVNLTNGQRKHSGGIPEENLWNVILC